MRDSVVAVHPGVVNTYLATNFFKTQVQHGVGGHS